MRQAFCALLLGNYEQLFLYGMHFTSNEEAVKDDIQKLFFRLWKKKMLVCSDSVDVYLYVSVRRILLRDKERRQSRREQNKRQKLFRKILQQLRPRQKEALLLRVSRGRVTGKYPKLWRYPTSGYGTSFMKRPSDSKTDWKIKGRIANKNNLILFF